MERQPSTRSCFVCGRDNPAGLGVRWHGDRAAGEVRATFEIAEQFHGFPGTVHGGILAAVLDEAAIRTALLDGGFEDIPVTARLELVYRRPTPTRTPLTVVARIVKRAGSRTVAAAELRLPDGTVAASAEALLARAPPEIAAAWAAEREHWRTDGE